MVGTTRPRISYFMNKFRKMGLIDYCGGLHVRKELEDSLFNPAQAGGDAVPL